MMRLPSKATIFYLLCFWALGTVAGICFKEGGTDPDHRVLYFVVGNVLGITSTWFLVRLYARMNVNLALLVAGGGSFVIFQVVLWRIYHVQLTFVQCAGIVMCLGGMVLTLWQTRAREHVQATSQAPAAKVEA
jgi:multidrug transporter EmrE-like cation transporter